MPFASFKNIQKRYARIHKERSQPERRKKLGLLPKKVDFIKRSRDHSEKQEKLKDLRTKSLLRNPDEFYFSMNNAAFDNELGHIPINFAIVKTEDEVKPILKMDIEMIKMEIQTEKSKIRRLRERFNINFADSSSSHTIFVDSDEEMLNIKEEKEEFSRKKLKAIDKKRIDLEKEAGYTELSARENRLNLLEMALKRRISRQQEVSCKNEIAKTEEINGIPVHRFKNIRKK